eukprot:m.103851 g.103851  ORF g.103851 m.103851 type:complete len:591 (-) comp12625_c0_seq1:62-1834(-)
MYVVIVFVFFVFLCFWKMRFGVVVLIAFVSAVASGLAVGDDTPSVSLDCGTSIYGSLDSANASLAVFKGIPFASPPVGKLRFTPAKTMTCPPGPVFNATNEGPTCYQSFTVATKPQSEDCLHMNVFTKGLSAHKKHTHERSLTPKLKPTLFWIYGGSNVAGSNSFYKGLENIVREEDICLFAPNYRLSALGFLVSSALAQDDPRGVSGNYAITDVIAALEWVQANAMAFGCDPSSVTVYGQSSGGTNIFALMSSKPAKGLFHAAISLSGSPNITQDLSSAQSAHLPLIKNTTCAKDIGNATLLAACLRGLPVKELMAAVPDTWNTIPSNMRPQHDRPDSIFPVGLPVVDGVTISMPVHQSFASGFVDVPLYISSMRDEGDLMPDPSINLWDYTKFGEYITYTFDHYPHNATGVMLALYGNVAYEDIPQIYYDMGTDIGMTCANVHLAHSAAKAFKSPVYLVRDDLPPVTPMHLIPGFAASKFPFHMWDYMKIQGAWDVPTTMGSKPYTPSARDISGGKLLRKVVVDMITTHTCPDLTPVSSSSSYPITNTLRESGDSEDKAVLDTVSNYKQRTCELLSSAGIDEKFYWIN